MLSGTFFDILGSKMVLVMAILGLVVCGLLLWQELDKSGLLKM